MKPPQMPQSPAVTSAGDVSFRLIGTGQKPPHPRDITIRRVS